MKASIIAHITAATLFSLLILLVYAAVQQTYRTAANDPQLQVARDIAHNVKYTHTYHYLSENNVDPKQSLGTFIQLYNADGQLIFSGGSVNGAAPHIPKGVLDNARQNNENAVSWQPAADVRLAAVAAYTNRRDTAYVVVARSLRETENREGRLTTMIMLFWAIGIGIIAVHFFVQRWLSKITNG